jgi:hypothetical protein
MQTEARMDALEKDASGLGLSVDHEYTLGPGATSAEGGTEPSGTTAGHHDVVRG